MKIRNWIESLFGGQVPVNSSSPVHAQADQDFPVRIDFKAGIAAYAERDYARAIECFGRVLDKRHDDADAHNNLGLSYLAVGRIEDAADEFVLAVHFRPLFAQAFYNLALAQIKRRQFVEATACLERALEIKPGYAAAHNALGYIFVHHSGRFEQGAEHIRRALELEPGDPDTLCNYTAVLTREGRLDEAIDVCERLLKLHPEMHEVRLNRGLAYLRLGRFADGWVDYEARKLAGGNFRTRTLDLPDWQGEPLAEGKLLIYAEQGIGDQIMFGSCIPQAMRRAACLVECAPELVTLFERSFGPSQIVAETDDATLLTQAIGAGARFKIAAGSLPLHYRSRTEEFPREPYLHADSGRIAAWRERLQSLGDGLKVGISWAGGAASTGGADRSIPLEQWSTVLKMPNCHFISLQYGDAALDRQSITTPLHHWQDAMTDFDETAALVCALDLVISVQTALVHLAGALGRPAWMLVQAACEWRYGTTGETMPWYPSVRLIRQQRPHEWAPVLQRVGHELAKLAAG